MLKFFRQHDLIEKMLSVHLLTAVRTIVVCRRVCLTAFGFMDPCAAIALSTERNLSY
jgi:hypothetical protein